MGAWIAPGHHGLLGKALSAGDHADDFEAVGVAEFACRPLGAEEGGAVMLD